MYLIKQLFRLIAFGMFLLAGTFFLANQDSTGQLQQTCSGCKGKEASTLPLVPKGIACLRDSMGVNLPKFYIELATWATPDTFSQIYPSEKKRAMGWMMHTYGNWPYIQAYYQVIDSLIGSFPNESTLGLYRNPQQAEEYFTHLQDPKQKALHPEFQQLLQRSIQRYKAVSQNASPWKAYIPYIHFHGFANQFHRGFSNLLRTGTWGIDMDQLGCQHCSCYTALPKAHIQRRIGTAFTLTLFLALNGTFFSLVIGILIAIIIHIAEEWKSSAFQGIDSWFLAISSVPTFVIAMALYIQFSVPSYQYSTPATQELLNLDNWYILGVALLVYLSLLVPPVVQVIYHGIREEIHKPYFVIALAKGNSLPKAILMHAFPNLRLLLLSLVMLIFTGLIGGSVIVEKVLGIPGLGMWVFESAENNAFNSLLLAVFFIGIWVYMASTALNFLYTQIKKSFSLPETRDM
ncbi:MAG: ABC transporter permease subunit [Bacteroidota bacterium]